MQEDARRTMIDRNASGPGLPATASHFTTVFPSARAFFCAAPFMLANSLSSRFAVSTQTKGWAVKALEFFDSGPPALLNNPPRSMKRVLFVPFLKHAMEVHYG